MPTTIRRVRQHKIVIGVDGCRGGWVFIRLNLNDGSVVAGIESEFRAILEGAGAQAQMTMVDMPIGLVDRGRRFCEGKARKLLKPLRHASVFSSPRRPMLDFETYEEANAWGKAQGDTGGGGLSKQAWMITPKIREIDQIITPAHQCYIGEGHPEIAFWRLNGGAPCIHPKRKKEGQAERKALLAQNGISEPDIHYEALRTKVGAKVALDDVYDACALALTARARLEGNAIHLTDGARDARGLTMEIWG